VFGKNIDRSNVKVRIEVEHFFPTTFNYFYMGNVSYMKLEDVLEIFQVLMLKKFLDQFIFLRDVNNAHRLLYKLHPSPIIK
jgi:hypothetical protein